MFACYEKVARDRTSENYIASQEFQVLGCDNSHEADDPEASGLPIVRQTTRYVLRNFVHHSVSGGGGGPSEPTVGGTAGGFGVNLGN